MQCVEHPKVETNLRCGKCDKLICPKCMVHTPVGARCKACAQLKRLPIFDVSPSQYGLAVGMGIFLSIVIGIAWAFIAIPFLSFWIPIGVGYVMGEVISVTVNRKRSVGLQVITGLSIFATYVFSRMVPQLVYAIGTLGLPVGALDVAELAALVVMRSLAQPLLLLVLGLGIFLGVTRVR